MAEPTLTAVFGANAVQSATTLTIAKSDLVAVGLTLADNVPAEKLLVAIMKLAGTNLTDSNRDSNIDQSVSIDMTATPSFTTRTNGATTETYIRNTITVELDKSYGTVEIDPDLY